MAGSKSDHIKQATAHHSGQRSPSNEGETMKDVEVTEEQGITKKVTLNGRLAFESLDVLLNEIESPSDYDRLVQNVLGKDQVRVRDGVLSLLTKASDEDRINAVKTVYSLHTNNVCPNMQRHLGALGVAVSALYVTHNELDPEFDFEFQDMLFTFIELIRKDTDEEANLADLFIRAAKMMPFNEYAEMFAGSVAQVDFIDCLIGAR